MIASTSHVPAIDSAAHKTHVWLGELAADAGLDDQAKAYSVLRAVMHALRDELTPQEAADLSAQLPMLVRGLYYEGWTGALSADHPRTRKGFLQEVASRLAPSGVDPEEAVRAVFRLLDHRVSEGEIQDVRSILPHQIRDLWPSR